MNDEISFEEFGVNENTILLEPRETYDKGILGFSEDGCHAVYSYEKLAFALAEQYKKETVQPYGGFLNMACEWLDYNTVRSLLYMNQNFVSIIIHEINKNL